MGMTSLCSHRININKIKERSVLCLDNHQSILVSAHTSAGKTVVAEYAISLALRDKQRVIYTTPIKGIMDTCAINSLKNNPIEPFNSKNYLRIFVDLW